MGLTCGGRDRLILLTACVGAAVIGGALGTLLGTLLTLLVKTAMTSYGG